jgi:hypothetical protein
MRPDVFTSRSQQGASLRLKKPIYAMIRSDPPPKRRSLLLSGRKVKGPFIYVLCAAAAAFMRICSAQDQRSYSQKHSCRTSVHFAACFYFYI